MAISDLIFIDAQGFHAPSYPQVLQDLKDSAKAIFGSDIALEDDTQDGQLLAIFARAIYDMSSVASAAYNSFSPATSSSDALTRNVKINGLVRRSATFSTVDVLVTGQAGTIITSGVAEDVNGIKWRLPASVTIPVGGSLTVTATAQDPGDITAQVGTVTKISTPTLGWQSVTNASAAVPGVEAEDDASLRRRQANSTENAGASILEGIVGAITELDGVTKTKAYENDTGSADANGFPAHSFGLVVEGGDSNDIAEQIWLRKTLGSRTFGTTTVNVTDEFGVITPINFYRPTNATVAVEIDLDALPGYLSTTADKIKQAVVDYIASLNIGDDVYLSKVTVPATLANEFEEDTFNVTSVKMSKNGGTLSASSVVIAFNEIAKTALANVTVNAT